MTVNLDNIEKGLRDWVDELSSAYEADKAFLTAAADRIHELEAENARLREAVESEAAKVVKAAAFCPQCGLKASSLLHRFCTHDPCVVREALSHSVPPGYQLVPTEPSEAMWGGLARRLVFWCRLSRPTGSELYAFLRCAGEAIPDWLVQEIPDTDHVPPKGTVAACIYKAMLAEGKKP
jgi:hypothetical protein